MVRRMMDYRGVAIGAARRSPACAGCAEQTPCSSHDPKINIMIQAGI